MKYQKSFLTFLVLCSMLSATACVAPTQQTVTQVPLIQTPASQVTPQETNNTEVVLSMVEHLNSGDVEGSLAYFADEAMAYTIGFPPTGLEIYAGKEQIRSLWQDSVNNHFKWEVEITSAQGDTVNTQAKTWHDFTRQIGVAPLEYNDVYELKDGKIITYGSWLTRESLERFRPAFAKAMPPEPTATPPSNPLLSEITVTIAQGKCTTHNPMTLKAGEIKVNLDVQDQENILYALTLFKLNPDKDFLDLMVATIGMPPSWADMLLYKELGPGKSETYTFTLEKGPVYLICWSKPPDLPIGNVGPIMVVP